MTTGDMALGGISVDTRMYLERIKTTVLGTKAMKKGSVTLSAAMEPTIGKRTWTAKRVQRQTMMKPK